jgi:hypothetical protein
MREKYINEIIKMKLYINEKYINEKYIKLK